MRALLKVVSLIVRLAPLPFLLAAVKELGWGVVVEDTDEMVEGLVIGTQDYIGRHTEDKDA